MNDFHFYPASRLPGFIRERGLRTLMRRWDRSYIKFSSATPFQVKQEVGTG